MVGEGAAGMGAGLAIGLALKEEAENTSRRKSRIGEDQALIKTGKSVGVVGKYIADLWSDTYYNSDEEEIYQKGSGWFDGFAAFVTATIVGCAMPLYFIVAEWKICDFRDYCTAAWYPLDFFSSVALCITISVIVGIIYRPKDRPVEYIRLTDTKPGAKILIKVYDGDGRRNIDEDRLDDIRSWCK
jgi:hypothetical protein